MFEIIPNWHAAIVHFPLALIPLSLLFSLMGTIFPNHRAAKDWAVMGHWLLWLGALFALFAVALGFQAYGSVNHDDAGHLAMQIHRNWAIPTALALTCLAVWDLWKSSDLKPMPVLALIVLAVVTLTALNTARLGAEVVYRHGVGVMPQKNEEMDLPKGYPHEHGHGEEGHSHDH